MVGDSSSSTGALGTCSCKVVVVCSSVRRVDAVEPCSSECTTDGDTFRSTTLAETDYYPGSEKDWMYPTMLEG